MTRCIWRPQYISLKGERHEGFRKCETMDQFAASNIPHTYFPAAGRCQQFGLSIELQKLDGFRMFKRHVFLTGDGVIQRDRPRVEGDSKEIVTVAQRCGPSPMKVKA